MKIDTKLALALVLVVVGVGAVAASFIIQKPIPSTVNIVTSPGLSVLDSACNTVQTSLSYPDVGGSAGATSQLSVCVKNTGNTAFFLVKGVADSLTFADLPTGLSGDWSATNPLPVELNPTQTQVVTITLTNDGSAVASTPSFTTVFIGYSTATG